MKDRYTIQIITPTGNMLGSFKFTQISLCNILSSIRNLYTERIWRYELKVDDGNDVSEMETTMHTANKRNQSKVDQLKKQIQWAADNGEMI